MVVIDVWKRALLFLLSMPSPGVRSTLIVAMTANSSAVAVGGTGDLLEEFGATQKQKR